MGKPYSSELNRIQSTISHAQDIDPTPIRNYLASNISRPFLIIGSGGSFSVAQIIAMVINKMGGVAQAVTPYELLEHAESMRSLNVVFFSAGGGNPDILSAYTFCKRMEARSTFVFCLTENSKLVQLAKDDSCNCDLFAYDLPGGKDGFLAVNSTVFAVTILQRVLSDKPINHCLPSNLPREIDDCIQENAIIAISRASPIIMGILFIRPPPCLPPESCS